MERYVTAFDGMFLPQGLALHRSLERHAGNYTLWVLCIDAIAADVLQRLNLPNVRLIRIEDVETDALREAKAGRSRAEYCWTLTPHLPGFVFERDPVAERVTYIDADFWLMKPLDALFSELEGSGKSVLITDHGYAPDYDQTATSGRYCVQFMTFGRGCGDILQWWSERCIEWCYARFEDGKFGDQMYLDDWPERFPGRVHVLRQCELILAPWNATRFPYGSAVAYHFHGLRLLDKGRVMLFRGYDIPKSTQTSVYGRYLKDLAAALGALAHVGHRAQPQTTKPGLHVQAGILLRKLSRTISRLRPVAIARLQATSPGDLP